MESLGKGNDDQEVEQILEGEKYISLAILQPPPGEETDHSPHEHLTQAKLQANHRGKNTK